MSSIRWQPLLIRGILKNISTGCGFFTADSAKRLIEAIEHSSLKEKCRIIENDSGLHFLLYLQTELSDQCLSEQLKQQGIKNASAVRIFSDSRKQPGAYLSLIIPV